MLCILGVDSLENAYRCLMCAIIAVVFFDRYSQAILFRLALPRQQPLQRRAGYYLTWVTRPLRPLTAVSRFIAILHSG